MVICLGQGGDLHMAQLMSLPLTIFCSSKSRLVSSFWYRLTQVVPMKGLLNSYYCCCCSNINTKLFYSHYMGNPMSICTSNFFTAKLVLLKAVRKHSDSAHVRVLLNNVGYTISVPNHSNVNDLLP